MKKIKGILSAIILLITSVLVILLFVTKLSGGTPEIFGYQILRISSPSMEPELQIGDIILSASVDDITTVKEGDIITYDGEFGDYAGKSITHEVVVAPYVSDGTYYLQTKGSANTYADPEITENQVTGKMVCKLTVFSAVYNFFATPWGLIVILGFLAILFINEAFALRQLIKENDDEEVTIEESSSQLGADEEADDN